MQKISFYLFKLTNKYIIINFFYIIIIVLFINALEISRIINNTDANFFYLIFLKIPSISSEIIPFVIIVSISFLIRNLISNNELISIRNIGLSILDVFKPIAISIFFFGSINLLIINPIAAKFEKKYQNITEKDNSNIYSIKFINDGLWIKNISDNNEKNYINIEKIDLENMGAENLKIFNSSIGNNKLITAKFGNFYEKELRLKKVKIYDIINDKIQNKEEYNININFSKSNILDSLSDYKYIPFYKYYDHIKTLKKFNIYSSEISLHYISELLKPFFLVLLGFVVLGFSGKYKRNENFFKILFISILIGFIIFLIKEIISTLTTAYNLPFLFSYLVIFTIPLLIGLYKIIKIEID